MASKELASNLKQITSGQVPTTSNLANGEMAFGLVGGVAKLYGNMNGTIVDFSNFLTSAPVTSVNNKTGAVSLTKGDIGLSNVDDVRQYSASNPPPYPVTSVSGKTGTVSLTKSDVGLGSVQNVDNTDASTITKGSLNLQRLSFGLITAGENINVTRDDSSGSYTISANNNNSQKMYNSYVYFDTMEKSEKFSDNQKSTVCVVVFGVTYKNVEEEVDLESMLRCFNFNGFWTYCNCIVFFDRLVDSVYMPHVNFARMQLSNRGTYSITAFGSVFTQYDFSGSLANAEFQESSSNEIPL